MLALLFVRLALAQECTATPITAAALSAEIREAFRSYEAEFVVFQRGTDAALASVSCVEDSIPAVTAAALHRNLGLSRLADGEQAAAFAAFRAAHAADSALTLPPGASVEAVSLWERAAAEPPSARAALPLRRGTSLRIDGTVADDRPVELPAVVQADIDGRIVWSVYAPAGPDITTPAYLRPTSSVASRAPRPPRPPLTARQKTGIARAVTWSGAGAAAVGSGVLFGLAVESRQIFDAHPDTYFRDKTNRRLIGSVAAGVGCVALSTLAIVVKF